MSIILKVQKIRQMDRAQNFRITKAATLGIQLDNKHNIVLNPMFDAVT
jgi:hypothetical protein